MGITGQFGFGPAGHHGPEQPGDEHGVVHQGAGVADPQLQRGHVLGRPDVEVGHLGVADDAGVDQVVEQAPVLRHGLQPAEAARGGPALPDHGPHAGIAGVAAPPERRAGGQGQQGRQGLPHPAGQPHGEVPVAHPHVHLIPADQLFVHQQPVLLVHPAEPSLHGQLEVEVGGLRGHAGGDHLQPELRGHGPQISPQADDLAPKTLERRGRGGVHLHRAPLQLGPKALFRQPSEEPGGARSQRAGPRFEELQLLLHSEGAYDCHPVGPYAPNVSGR